MSWDQWPYHPRSLTEMIGPREKVKNGELFISLLVSGWCERLERPLTVLEPILDEKGNIVHDHTLNVDNRQWKLRRIDHINPKEHYSSFCSALRKFPDYEESCQEWDKIKANEIIQEAINNPKKNNKFAEGYPCWMNLIDQAGVIRYDRTPVAVVFSGQFLPDTNESRKKLFESLDQLASQHGVIEEQKTELKKKLNELETITDYSSRHFEDKEVTATSVFLDVLEEIENIALAQFRMHKSELEHIFRRKLRGRISNLSSVDRCKLAEQTEDILLDVRNFFGANYLALFVSPQKHVSYQRNLNLLLPFAISGINDEAKAEIQHFNWRKAGLISGDANHNNVDNEIFDGKGYYHLWTEHQDILRFIDSGLKSENKVLFRDVVMLSQMDLSDEYRAILFWGPFAGLDSSDLKKEKRLIDEVAELIMTRVLSSIQLNDSEYRTDIWGQVATLLSHHSRRVMTPVSSGVRIVNDYLQGKENYSKEDALGALKSLETASDIIRKAVRAPVFSFAAMAEDLYEFTPTSLSSLVDDCIALYKPVANEKGVTFSSRSLDSLPDVVVDRDKMRDAIGYIMDNAVKYSHPDKEVRIYGYLSGRDVRLIIEDFGLGIPDDEIQKVFDHGFQGQRSKKALHEEGEGVGLYHARIIVEAHKGKIWCENRTGDRDKYSAKLAGYRVLFTIELPLSDSKANGG